MRYKKILTIQYSMAKVNQIKYCITLLVFILCTHGVLQAQQDDDERLFWGGLTFGANYTQVDGDNFAGYHKVGIHGGACLFINLGKPVVLGMELLYTQKGARAGQSQLPKLSNDKSTVIVDYKIHLNYAEVPLILHLFDEKKNNFGAGLSAAYLGSSKEIFKDGNGAVYEQEAKLYPFRKIDLNFVANAGAHIWKGLGVNLRFQYSMLSIRNAANYLTGRTQQYNNIVTTRLIYIF